MTNKVTCRNCQVEADVDVKALAAGDVFGLCVPHYQKAMAEERHMQSPMLTRNGLPIYSLHPETVV